MNYGKRIKELREQAGLTQAELADMMGVTHSNISQIESDDRKLELEKADKLAQALGVTLNDLMKE